MVVPKRAMATCSLFTAPTVPDACPRIRPLRSSSLRTLQKLQPLGTFLSFLTLKCLISYWSIVPLHCCVSFRCIAKSFSYIYTYIYSFSDSFPIQVITEYWIEFLVLYSRSLLIIYYIYQCIYVNPNLLIYPTPCLSSLVTISLFSKSVSRFCFVNKFICIIFQILRISDIILYLSFSV